MWMAEAANPCRGRSPYLTVKDAIAALAVYREAFSAEEQFRLTGSDGKIGHAEIHIGGPTLMLADEWPEFSALSPPTTGGSPVKLHLYVDDADVTVARAIGAGATSLRPAAD